MVDRTLSYGAVGNPTQIVDGVNGETINYTYDELDRLLALGALVTKSYAYNVIGNITSKAGLAYTYNATHKHAVSTVNAGPAYGCDANGNIVTRGGQTIQYDPTNRPVKVTVGSTISRYTYDGDGKRTKRLDANGTIHYPGPHLERNLGTATGSAPVVTKFYYATLGSQRRLIAFRKAGTVYYVGVDHLGGTARVMDSSFTAVDQTRYKSYVEARDTRAALQTDRLFTGQTLDAIAGTYW